MAKIAIDLGTTTSLAATFREGSVELIPNKFGNYITPSVVSVDEEGNIIVGEIAKERLITHPSLTVASFKKDMGTNRVYQLGTNPYTPQELSSFVIASIIEDAKNYLGEEIEEVIISVPAYFQDKQRVATKKAGAMAGIKVTRLINEPSAAALNAYLDQTQEERFLVFDFGGGTLDISIVECFENMIEIISVAGDNHLGGDDFNEAIALAFLQEKNINVSQLDNQEFAILKKLSEAVKLDLTSEKESTLRWNWKDNEYSSIFTSQKVIEECGVIFGKIKNLIAHALRDGELMSNEINAIVCAGGSSKMPSVKAYLKHLFPNIPLIEGNEQEMIVRGLGVVLGIMERDADVKDYIMTDICPFTLGIETLNEQDPKNTIMTPILPRNTALPCSREQRFYTSHDNQTEIKFKILQGEQLYAKDNLNLGEVQVSVPAKPVSQESIDVRFTYDINGILEVDITVTSNQNKLNHIFSSTLNEEEVENARKQLKKLKHHPKNEAQNRLVKERLLSAYAIANSNSKSYIMRLISQFDIVLQEQDERRIRRYRVYLENVLNQIENIDPFYTEEFDFEEEDE